MDIMPILNVVLTVSGVGAFLGGGLAAAAQYFAVEEDEKVSAIEEVLPGINCGACGYPGCAGYAKAVASGSDVPSNLCIPGGEKVTRQIGEITGKAADAAQKRVSILRCAQDCRRASPRKYEYSGITDCDAIEMLHKGSRLCRFACTGMGNCARECPAGAIQMVHERPVINPDLCTGCGICVKTCPRNVLTLALYPGRVQVYCRNTGKPKDKRKACPSACIGCSLCVKNCPYEAVKVENFLAVVDHSKCPADCPRPCLDRCPTAAILARGLGCHEKNEALLAKHKNLLT